jgi:glycosyltransferase involved in cell wall biosynthesis
MGQIVMDRISRTPKVTVLMPTYNGAKVLREAIDSILTQTFGDFEFHILNDGSLDKSVDIIRSYADGRIRLEHNEGHLGLISTLNRGLDLARGGFIARMDWDDTSFPTRLEKQVYFMQVHPELGVCGTWIEVKGKNNYLLKYPQVVNPLHATCFSIARLRIRP